MLLEHIERLAKILDEAPVPDPTFLILPNGVVIKEGEYGYLDEDCNWVRLPDGAVAQYRASTWPRSAQRRRLILRARLAASRASTNGKPLRRSGRYGWTARNAALIKAHLSQKCCMKKIIGHATAEIFCFVTPQKARIARIAGCRMILNHRRHSNANRRHDSRPDPGRRDE